MNKKIYVTGHRHPDSDAICAAITYADLLRHLGEDSVACRQGPLNEETKFILKKFNQENPLLLTDARTTISDIDIDEPAIIRRDETVHHAWHVMLQTQNRSLFVVDENNKLCGICTTSNLSYVRLKEEVVLSNLMATATLDNIARTIGGRIIVRPKEFKTNGVVHVITLDNRETMIYTLAGGISILSSGSEKQKLVIDMGCRLLVVTCAQKVDSEIVRKAQEQGVAVIETDQDTMHTARVITESYSVENIMSKDVMYFTMDEYVDDVAQKMAKHRVRSYPVLDDEGNIIGAISRYHTLNYPRRRMALVDHSAVNQSIGHIETAYIEAIVDHHHIGNITTDHPIYYRNLKCGCTCTIISMLYQENGLLPDKEMSGLLMSAILSDTLNFKSATTTEMDHVAVAWLAKRAGIDDVDAYARDMLGASVALKDSSMHTILNRDLKYYDVGEYHFAIGQTNFSHMEDVQKLLPEFKENMQKEQQEKKLDLEVMLFTDVMGEGSLFVFYGPLSYLVADVIETNFDDHSGFDPTIISRKQQLMPKLFEAIKNI
ncbi:MAG: putative manganese-dependent inorganic diphosphatase [Solobacterium sp.]|nr:putative manganese-dependent inorganic diphosphatase [Solobacterium sp.]